MQFLLAFVALSLMKRRYPGLLAKEPAKVGDARAVGQRAPAEPVD